MKNFSPLNFPFRSSAEKNKRPHVTDEKSSVKSEFPIFRLVWLSWWLSFRQMSTISLMTHFMAAQYFLTALTPFLKESCRRHPGASLFSTRSENGEGDGLRKALLVFPWSRRSKNGFCRGTTFSRHLDLGRTITNLYLKSDLHFLMVLGNPASFWDAAAALVGRVALYRVAAGQGCYLIFCTPTLP